jgi:hypothetical protein
MKAWLVVLFLGVIPASASQISGAADLIGTTFTVVGMDSVQKGNELSGIVQTCTFIGGICSLANQFNVVVTPPNSQTSAADWTVSNLSTLNMLSLSLNGVYASAPAAGQFLTAFNPAVDQITGHPSYTGAGSPAVTCGPTTGIGGCLEATSTPGGTTAALASVLYSNALHPSGQVVNLDFWGTITLTFNTSPFQASETFQFKIDTDGLTGASVDIITPEPGTLGMAALGLLLFGASKTFHRKS